MMWLVDFVGYSLRTAPPLSTTRTTVHILQNHYPERLGAALCYYPPRLFSYTWRVSSLLHAPHRARSPMRLHNQPDQDPMRNALPSPKFDECQCYGLPANGALSRHAP